MGIFARDGLVLEQTAHDFHRGNRLDMQGRLLADQEAATPELPPVVAEINGQAETAIKPAETETREYTAKDIQVLEGLEAVRVRPGMYIGSTDQRGLHHLIYEILDNAVDEAMAGFCTRVELNLGKDGLIAISDNGRGIPVDVHPSTGKSGLETVMTTLHAGGKFGGGAYKVTGGLHGVGGSVVNGLSSYLKAEVHREGHVHHQEYSQGLPTGEVIKGKRTSSHGTTISFRPDPEIFPDIEYDFDMLTDHFKEIAYLNKGLEIRFASPWHENQRRGDIERTYYFDGGIANLVRNVNKRRRVFPAGPLLLRKGGGRNFGGSSDSV